MTITYRILGKRIKQVREDAGLSQEELGTKLGVTQPAYGRYELGIREMSIDQLFQLSRVLGRSVPWLLGIDTGLTDDEDEILTIYQSLSADARRFLLLNARSYLEEEREAK